MLIQKRNSSLYHMKENTGYVFTIKMDNPKDLKSLEIFKTTVQKTNTEIRSQFNGGLNPTHPKRVMLRGRGPRRQAEIKDGVKKGSYKADLPLKHAVTADVYIYNDYRLSYNYGRRALLNEFN